MDLAGLVHPADRTAAPGPGLPDEIVTIAGLAERGIMLMGDEEIRAATAGRTMQTVNLVTGQSCPCDWNRQ